MPYLPTSQEWLTQSALLLQARPTSARITTKYTLSRPSTSIKSEKRRAAAAAKIPSDTTAAPPAPPAPKAILTLKTYDPVSGTTLKYHTDKAQEVGRLILSLSRLGRGMAGLPELKEDAPAAGEAMEGVEKAMGEAVGGGAALGGATAAGSGTATPIPAAPSGKNKKKKGKK